ncbi:hypothetical protein [Candidatus Formimonas warabiya]|uniref:hypothetical protein n=1 Tax=Formimonas warabiya TaxID=1761012 RepID=UPI001BE4D63E|nr:hypothetical protein [Candidatus Formimonas warabiya]
MTEETIASLKKEKNLLLHEYLKAQTKDKAKILVKIIDIDDRLEEITKKIKKA